MEMRVLVDLIAGMRSVRFDSTQMPTLVFIATVLRFSIENGMMQLEKLL